jgi:hypothetical protein
MEGCVGHKACLDVLESLSPLSRFETCTTQSVASRSALLTVLSRLIGTSGGLTVNSVMYTQLP